MERLMRRLNGSLSRSVRRSVQDIFQQSPLDLRFALQKTLDPRITHTRASSATFVDSSGVLRSAVTNLLLRSEEFNSGDWTKVGSTISVNSIASPTGAITADTLVEDTSTGTHRCVTSTTIANTTIHTVSVYAKAAGRTHVRFSAGSGLAGEIIANLSNGTVASSSGATNPTVQLVGDGWYRVSFTTAASSSTTGQVQVQLVQGTSTVSYTGDGTSSLYIWGAQLEQASTVGDYVPTTSAINSAPRFDHNPTTGESLGLLVEEARTNSVTNNTMVGAVAGTPGTLPTSWAVFVSPTGLTRTVVGSGTVNGINYIDVRFNGTPSSTGEITLYLSPTATAATSGQAWTASAWLSLAGGSTSNIATVALRNFELNSGTYVRETATNFVSSISSDFIRRQHVTSSFGASANQIQSVLTINATAGGTPIDITLRIGLPQLELGAFATSVIPTTTATVTRAADVASITGANFGTTRTNLLLRSEEFDNASWVKVRASISANTITAPNGTLTADTGIEDTSSSTTHNPLIQDATIVANGTYTASLYVRAKERSRGAIWFSSPDSANYVSGEFNLNTGTIATVTAGTGSGASAAISNVGDGWFRVSITGSIGSSLTTGRLVLRMADASGSVVYTGDGASGIYLWGAQLETGSAATPYIPTTTAAVSVFESSWYNQTEGTWFAQHDVRNMILSANNNSFAERQPQMGLGAGLAHDFYSITGGAIQANAIGGPHVVGTPDKTVFALKANDFIAALNGTLFGADTSGLFGSSITQLNIGALHNNTSNASGPIRRITYWPTRLANTTLQQITQP
jgi:hypothetical protein